MKHVISTLSLTLSLLLCAPNFASAQTVSAPLAIDEVQKEAHIYNPQFERMVRSALSGNRHKFPFSHFRRYYALTRQYDPIGDKTLNKMTELAFQMKEAKDKETFVKAQEAYQNIIMNHMAHLGVVMQALSLAREDKRFGDYMFFNWLKEGLINNVIISGDGYSLDGAYDVITMQEETVLFNRINMKQLSSKANVEGRTFYTMHKAEDLKTGQVYTIFVNTSFPMKFLEGVAKLNEGFTLKVNKDLGFTR